MTRFARLISILALAAPLMLSAGCKTTQKTASVSSEVALCTKCGQIKGSAACCRPGQTLCSKCGLVKGSPGCCRITKGSSKPVYLCAHCGQIKGSVECCKPGQPTCTKCGLVKGSPGCCKIKKAG